MPVCCWIGLLVGACDAFTANSELGTNGLGVQTALAGTLGAGETGKPPSFVDLDVPHTEVMLSDFAHGCGATSAIGTSLYIELYGSSVSERHATPGDYKHWQPNINMKLPDDDRFVAVLSNTSNTARSDSVAMTGTVEVFEVESDRIRLAFDLLFENGRVVSGTMEAQVCAVWHHSWQGIARLSPETPRN
jgi:hypothetical protein